MIRGTSVLLGLAVAGLLVAAACGPSGSGYAVSASPGTSPSTAPVYASPRPSAVASPVATGTEISVANSRLGQILVDANGRTLYLFRADSPTASACNSSACVLYWPPLLTKGAPHAGAGVDPSLLGTITRQDGTREVTYAGHPLYYFLTDKKAGDVTGQGVDGFGAKWYVVSPSGAQIS